MIRRKAAVSELVATLVFSLVVVFSLVLVIIPACASTALAAAPETAAPPSGQYWSFHGLSAASIQNKLIQNQAIKSFAIKEAVSLRCHRYLGGRCGRLAADLDDLLDDANVALLDQSLSVRVETSVAFRSQLFALSNDQRVYYFLKDLNSELEASASKPDVWAVAVRNARDEREALKWLAVLFQDTTASQTQVEVLLESFARTSPTPTQKAVLVELQKSVATFIQADREFESGAGGDPLVFYPPDARGAAALVNGSFYHYYVPAYIAQQLVDRGHTAREAVFGAYVFNYIYKVYKASRSPLAAVAEPRAIADRDEATDIFEALLGAYRGVGLAGQLKNAAGAFALIQVSPGQLLKLLGRQELPAL